MVVEEEEEVKLIEEVHRFGEEPLRMSKHMVSMADHSFKHDRDAKECDLCDKAFGKLTNRRHHCRGCRAAVCDACSPHKIEVPDWDGLQVSRRHF